ncbi:hypothetical protein NLJ89_g9354 [Agrocybe chaxingu]|uniref:Uncharacterized protein n=1 Tax=Agrocybe chaxingu TaxID=84603 RepID=A0A9W8MRW9_9AGAR|nr:hypothetical protein NLJ89_g9354 [Agrocybe chaxingu]
MKDDSASKPARACDACYETVFPVIDTPPPEEETTPGEESGDVEPNHEQHNTDTITSLSHLPSWLSMPALPVQRTPQALMAIDLNSSRDQDLSLDIDKHIEEGGYIDERDRRARVKVRSHQRIRSYQQILEDFQEQARIMKQEKAARQRRPPGPSEDGEEEDAGDDAGDEMDEQQDQIDDIYFTPTHSALPSPVSSPRKPQRREDTARRSKRFSLPAIALHATSVTARTSTADSVDSSERTPVSASSGAGAGVGGQIPENASVGDLPSSASAMPGKSKRFSLVLAGRNSVYSEGGVSKQSSEEGVDMGGLAKGVAAAKLSELLGRKSKG